MALARQYLADADIVLAEGFKRAPHPQDRGLPAAPWRRRRSTTPAAPDADCWVAIVTDDRDFDAPLPGDPLPATPCGSSCSPPSPGSASLAHRRRDRAARRAAEAARRILDDVRRQPALRVPLDDALDSVLAEDVVSPLDIPAWTNSAMDGYAARGDDVRGARPSAPVRLRVVEELPAGASPPARSGRANAPASSPARRSPRAPTPWCGRRTPTTAPRRVTIVNDRDVGVNLRRVGEDIRRGTTVLAAGTTLGPAQLGVLASLAVAHPLVYRRPRVAILGSGDEIVDVDQPEEILSGRKIASSNTHTLWRWSATPAASR